MPCTETQPTSSRTGPGTVGQQASNIFRMSVHAMVSLRKKPKNRRKQAKSRTKQLAARIKGVRGVSLLEDGDLDTGEETNAPQLSSPMRSPPSLLSLLPPTYILLISSLISHLPRYVCLFVVFATLAIFACS